MVRNKGLPPRATLGVFVCAAALQPVVLHAASARPAADPALDCEFRKLAFKYACKILAGRGLRDVAQSLDLSLVEGSDSYGSRGLASCTAASKNSDSSCNVSTSSCPQMRDRRPLPGDDFHASASGHAIYVDAARGSDAGDGSVARPLRSLQAAQAAARAARGGATVYLREGTYTLSEPLVFSGADSGPSAAEPKVWTSFPGERAVVSGGVALQGLRWVRNASTGIWHAPLPAGIGEISQLFGGGRREIRARFPNGDPLEPGSGFTLTGTSMGYPNSGSCSALTNNMQVYGGPDKTPLCEGHTRSGVAEEVTVPWPAEVRPTFRDFRSFVNGSSRRFDLTYNGDFWGSSVPQGVSGVKGLPGALWQDPSTGIVHMYHPGRWGGWQIRVGDQPAADVLRFMCRHAGAEGRLAPCSTEAPGQEVLVEGAWQEARGAQEARTGAFYVENVLELLDAPREWFHDQKTSTLFYMPENGVDPNTLEFTAALLSRVVEIRGTGKDPARHLQLKGLVFAHSATTFMQRYEVPSGGDWSIHRGAAVFLEDAEDVAVIGCFFDQLGGNALFLSNSVERAQVINNTFFQTGDSAILSVGSSQYFDATTHHSQMPAHNLIQGNLIDTVGVFGKQTAGYFKALSDSNMVKMNVFMNGPRSAVNFNDGAAGGEQLVGNLMFNFVRETADHGMFNSWDRQPYLYTDRATGELRLSPRTHYLANNFCLNRNYATTRVSNSLYCFDHDDASSQYLSVENVMVHGGFKVRDGVNRTQQGNLVVSAVLAGVQVAGYDTVYLYNNTVMDCGGAFLRCVGDAFGGGTQSAKNHFYKPNDTLLGFHPRCPGAGSTLKEWQKNGDNYDSGSSISSTVSVDDLLSWARSRLGLEADVLPQFAQEPEHDVYV